MTAPRPRNPTRPHDLSLVMPCYDEEDNVSYTIAKLFQAFISANYALELVAVNNGSRDRTGEVLTGLAAEYPGLRVITVEQNVGFGNGILSGLPHCQAAWIGVVAADGQVDAEDTVRLFEAAVSSRSPVLAKVRRRFRMDGLVRKFVSVCYNVFVRMLWPKLGSWDVNGVPFLAPREVLLSMRLESRNWFLNPELLVKAHYLGIRVLELNVFARMRGNGLSHVRAATCWEFFRSLLAYRLRPRPAWLRLPSGQEAPGSSSSSDSGASRRLA
jgi:glycosyltransferase involved in cell wall biosynthesis